MNIQKKQRLALRRHQRARRKLAGTPERPRMSVKFSQQHIYVQFVDDQGGVTLAATSTRQLDAPAEAPFKANVASATVVGTRAAEVARARGLTRVVFDRGSARYHGKVKALADAARAGGLEF